MSYVKPSEAMLRAREMVSNGSEVRDAAKACAVGYNPLACWAWAQGLSRERRKSRTPKKPSDYYPAAYAARRRQRAKHVVADAGLPLLKAHVDQAETLILTHRKRPIPFLVERLMAEVRL